MEREHGIIRTVRKHGRQIIQTTCTDDIHETELNILPIF